MLKQESCLKSVDLEIHCFMHLSLTDWGHYSQKEQQRKYAVIIGHYFFSCYTQSYYKVQEALTNGLLCCFFQIRVHLALIVIYVYLNWQLVLCIHVSLRKSFTIIANELCDCYLPCHSTLGLNENFLFFYYIDSHYGLFSLFLICFYLPLFKFNLLDSFQEIDTTSDTTLLL